MSDRLVSTEWLSANLGSPTVRIVEAGNSASFSIGHVPGAIRLDQAHLIDVTRGDFVDSGTFATVMSALGINRDDTVVLYGNTDNSAAALAVWLLTLFGHADVCLLDGGRAAWLGDDRETSFEIPEPAPTNYPSVRRNDAPHRISREGLRSMVGKATIVDTRSPSEYSGDVTVPTGFESESCSRGGHIPTAVNLPRTGLTGADGRLHGVEHLTEKFAMIDVAQPVIVYDRIAARAAETWFVLRFLLGLKDVRVYDGGWMEWGNSIGLPVVQGSKP